MKINSAALSPVTKCIFHSDKHLTSNSSLSVPWNWFWFPFLPQTKIRVPIRDPLDRLWLWPSNLTVWGVYGADKAAPALAGDLHRSCGVLLCSLRPQQFYNHASAKHRGHGEMMPEIRMERSRCPVLWGWLFRHLFSGHKEKIKTNTASLWNV